jgi:hypothetical protein
MDHKQIRNNNELTPAKKWLRHNKVDSPAE